MKVIPHRIGDNGVLVPVAAPYANVLEMQLPVPPGRVLTRIYGMSKWNLDVNNPTLADPFEVFLGEDTQPTTITVTDGLAAIGEDSPHPSRGSTVPLLEI